MTSTIAATRAADPQVVRHYLGELRYATDDDLRYQIEEIRHVFWLVREAGIEHDTDCPGILAARHHRGRKGRISSRPDPPGVAARFTFAVVAARLNPFVSWPCILTHPARRQLWIY
jgi:hypothetical protein